jgi:tetratricopeptide (TPR) repeat protein
VQLILADEVLELGLRHVPNCKSIKGSSVPRGGEVKRMILFLFSALCASVFSSYPAFGLTFEAQQLTATSQRASLQDSVQDPDELTAFVNAMNEPNRARKAVKLETFILHYPNSSALPEAFEEALVSYKGVGNLYDKQYSYEQFEEAKSLRRSEIPVNNLVALAVAFDWTRVEASVLGNQLPEIEAHCAHAQQAVQALSAFVKPSNISEGRYRELRQHLSVVIYGMAGFCEFTRGNYQTARDFYLKTLALDPNNLANLNELAASCLSMHPIDVAGFWYAARSDSLFRKALPTSPDLLFRPLERQYEDYHGSLEGWDQIVRGAASQAAPPPGFTVTQQKVPGAR